MGKKVINYADEEYKKLICEINKKGIYDKDTNVRPKYADGNPAYTKSIFGYQIKYPKNVLPLITLKQVFVKTAIKEMLLFWVKQTVQEKDFHADNVHIWDEWFNEKGNLGKSYAYQLQDHKVEYFLNDDPKPKKDISKLDLENYIILNKENIEDIIDKVTKEWRLYADIITNENIVEYCKKEFNIHNITKEQYINILVAWYATFSDFDMVIVNNKAENVYFKKGWLEFKNFLNEARWLDNYFLFNGYNYLSQNLAITCDNSSYVYDDNTTYFYCGNKHTDKLKPTKNQVVNLLKQIKTNPKSRRLMTSFWNFSDVDDKQLQECAFQTQYRVNHITNDLDLILTQRSMDTGLGNPFNTIQYKILQKSIAKFTGYNDGEMTHHIGDAHYYDRHEDVLIDLIEKDSYEQPTIELRDDINSFFDLTIDDFIVKDYKHGENIKLEVAI